MKVVALSTAACALALGSGWSTFHDDGVSVAYPSSWHATAHRLTPVTGPRQLLAIASIPLPTGYGGADGCEPKQVLDRLPPTGAFVFGWDDGTLRDTPSAAKSFPPRPRRFALPRLVHSGCLGPSYPIRFREAGRLFQIYVVLGGRAGRSTRATVLRILDSFRVTSR
jgi:hypothetical protein